MEELKYKEDDGNYTRNLEEIEVDNPVTDELSGIPLGRVGRNVGNVLFYNH